MDKCKVIAVTNQKGGVGKTTTTVNLGVGLAQQGKKVLLVDTDPQGSLTVSLGVKNPDELDTTISDLMQVVVDNGNLSPRDNGILKDIEGVDLVPSNIGLSSFEVSLVNTMSREFVLRSYLGAVKRDYDYVLIDCMPSLGMLTINALAAADSVLIPCQANYLSTKGLKLLMGSVAKVRRQINPALKIDGILLTMVDNRTNNAKSIIAALRQTGSNLRVLDTEIPFSVRAAECSVEGKSIFAHDGKGKVAAAYKLPVGDSSEDSTASEEPTPSLEPSAKPSASPVPDTALAPAPRETQAPAVEETPPPKQTTITFNATTQKGTGESPSPTPSAVPEPEPAPTPALPAETPPPASAESTFSIDHWISYAQNYARDAGLNLDATVVDCWDTPITAGAHCTCLERDIQSRLNRYARDESITDVWIWAESRSDGNYDLYIGYA